MTGNSLRLAGKILVLVKLMALTIYAQERPSKAKDFASRSRSRPAYKQSCFSNIHMFLFRGLCGSQPNSLMSERIGELLCWTRLWCQRFTIFGIKFDLKLEFRSNFFKDWSL